MSLKNKIFLCFLVFFSVSKAQQNNLELAIKYYNEEKYSVAQSLFDDIASEQAIYYSAACSKMLFTEDAKYKLHLFLEKYNYSQYCSKANLSLAEIYYREKDFNKTIAYYLKVNNYDLNNEHRFKLAYSYFMLEFFDEATYYFSKLLHKESKYASIAQYYFAHISYQQGFYKRALIGFNKLRSDEKFAGIIPYYITQIYFYQKEYNQLISYSSLILDKVIVSRKAEVNRLVAEAYFQLEDYKQSITYFEIYFKHASQLNAIDYAQLGYAYYNVSNYMNAIKFLEQINNSGDSLEQFVAYYLAGSYLNLSQKNYALNAFKKVTQYENNTKIKEDAMYNYAKLSFELDLPFDNTLKIIEKYLKEYTNSEKHKELESMMVQLLQKTSKYKQAYNVLKEIHQPTRVQKMKLQQLAFFLGVKQYNVSNFKQAISLFQESNSYRINNDLSYMSIFWLADCYYQLGDYDTAILHYCNLPLYSNESVQYYFELRKYNLAYCYFQLGKYYEANQLFRSYIKTETDSMRLNDTYLRIADGFFMQNEFSLAQKYYNKAKKIDLFDADYALYNRSICLGFLNKNTRKIHLLNDLVNHYKQSIYYDNALMDLANYHNEHNNYELALSLYDTLLHNNKVNVAFRSKAMLRKGMIYFNTNKAEKAIEIFKYIITIYPHYAAAKEALSGLQMVYLSIAQVEEYLAFIHNLPGASISRGKQDSLTYHTAFMKFSEGDYIVAKKTFYKYLDNFKDGIFKQDATYYYASSCLQVGDTTTTIKQFALISKHHLKHNEHASLFLARHYYGQNKYTFSNQYYQKVEQFASTNSLKREAIIRLMYGFDGVKKLDIMDRRNLYKYAEKVLVLEKSDDWLRSRATLIVARYQFDVGNYAKSKKTFEKVEELSEYDAGAEAKYYLAYLAYLDDSLVLAEQLIFELTEQYSSDHFIAKAFILLADIYIDQENNFQAKATLESVIENHDGADLVNHARKKWELIMEREVLLNTIKEHPQSYIEILEEEIDYDLEEFLIEEVVIDVNYEVVISDSTSQQTDSLELINENIIKDEIE